MASEQVTTPATTSLVAVLGKNIRSARDEAGMTQADLATALGVREKQTISNWERGLFKPSDENLAGLCAVLAHGADWFYTDHSEPKAAA